MVAFAYQAHPDGYRNAAISLYISPRSGSLPAMYGEGSAIRMEFTFAPTSEKFAGPYHVLFETWECYRDIDDRRMIEKHDRTYDSSTERADVVN